MLYSRPRPHRFRSHAPPRRSPLLVSVTGLRRVAFLLVGLAIGCRRDPEALTWRLPRDASPPAALDLAPLWDVPAPFCPQELAAGGPGLATLWEGDHRSLIGLADGLEVPGLEPAPLATPDPTVAAVLDRHPEFAGRTEATAWEGLALFALPERGTLVAFDLAKERTAWEFHAAAATRVAPQVIRGRVVLLSLDNHLYCLRAKNGHQVWRARAAARLTLAAAIWRDRVIVAPEGSPELESFHLRDGSPAGRFKLGQDDARVSAPPAVIEDVLLVSYSRYGSTTCRVRAGRLREGGLPG